LVGAGIGVAVGDAGVGAVADEEHPLTNITLSARQTSKRRDFMAGPL
jgi:hypothetical protein